jgi:hypothetical protein
MTTPVTLPPGPPANPGLDFAYLRDEGTRIIQRQAGKVWTDYNESDPGVTTLEQLCYALTELSYRAELPLADLLVGHPGGEIDPRRQALYAARDILPVNPVTEDDYRRLLIDRVPRVANAWITPYRPEPDAPRGLHGLYDVELYAPGLDPACSPDGERKLEDAVRRVYSAHRNLCEDLRSVRVLAQVPVTVHAEVAVSGTHTPDRVMAGLLFRLGLFFAPEPARRPLDALLGDGVPPSDIFDGPLPRNGFIADAELQPKAEAVAVRDAARAAAAVPGVLGVPRLTVRAGGHTYGPGGAVPVGRGRILRLAARPGRGGFSIRLLCNGVEVRPDPARVERALRRLWAEHRQPWPLDEQYPESFAMPAGRHRDLSRYYSVQNGFPAVYGISAYGLPPGATDERRAQARQLKAYLLPFEQLMADGFAQLAHMRDLFSTLGPEDPDGARSYWYQYLDDAVPDVRPVLRDGPDGYHHGLRAIVESQDPWVERRGRFLAFLLALYADGLAPGDVAGAGGDACGGADPAERARAVHGSRLELLRRLVESTWGRGRAFDYLRRPSPENAAGMELRCRIQLGMPTRDRRALVDVLQETGVQLRPRADGDDGDGLDWHGEHIETAFEAVSAPCAPAPGPAGGGAGVVVHERMLDGDGPDDVRVGTVPGDDAFSAVSRAGSGWLRLGRYPDRESAAAAGREYGARMRHLRRHARQLYVVEHLLLRDGRYRCDPPAGGFPYDFALTAVFFLPPRLLDDPAYLEFAREIVRANTPAHLTVSCCFLSASRGARFEPLYRAWQQALERRAGVRAAAARLRAFLDACAAAPPASAAARRRGEC